MDHQGAIQHIINRLDNELPDHLTYHGQHHTLDVLETVERIAVHEGVSDSELNTLMVAAAFHDSGFIYGHNNHEERGCEMAQEALPEFGFGEPSIHQICQMIMATKVPQNPTCKLCNILCDADLDYLGRDDFKPVAKSLYDELHHLGIVKDLETWNRIQVGFLKEHFYHTSYGKTYRQPKKEIYLKELEELVANYND